MKTNNRFLLVLFFFFFTSMILFAFGGREETVPAQIVQVTGLVRLVGSSPMHEIVISGSEYEWYVARDEMGKLFDLQQQTVTVEGEETVMELKFANGMPAGVRRNLRNIRVISARQSPPAS